MPFLATLLAATGTHVHLCIFRNPCTAVQMSIAETGAVVEHISEMSWPCRLDRLAQAIPQWQSQGSGYVSAMRVGTEAHAMKECPWYEPLGVLTSHKYYMYASGCMYALSREAVQLCLRNQTKVKEFQSFFFCTQTCRPLRTD